MVLNPVSLSLAPDGSSARRCTDRAVMTTCYGRFAVPLGLNCCSIHGLGYYYCSNTFYRERQQR
jgi:hypothetical protein